MLSEKDKNDGIDCITMDNSSEKQATLSKFSCPVFITTSRLFTVFAFLKMGDIDCALIWFYILLIDHASSITSSRPIV
jgi:hypothetical protein